MTTKSSKKAKKPTKSTGIFQDNDEKGPYAVVVADLNAARFRPLTHHVPHCLLPLAGVPLLHYSLTRLIQDGFRDILIYACSHVQQVRDYISNATCYRDVRITVHHGEGSRSLGDVLRDLDSSQTIRSMTDFLLIPADLISASPLLPLLRQHEARRAKSANAILSLCFPPNSPHLTRAQTAERASTVVFSRSGGDCRLMRLINRAETPSLVVSLFELARGDACVEVASDLMDLGIVVCSNHIPPLFQDNFDYQTIHDLVCDVLTNEEVLGYTIHVDSLPVGPSHLLAAPDLTTLIQTHSLVLNRTGITTSLIPALLTQPEDPTCVMRCAGPSAYAASTASIHPRARLIGACLIGPRCTVEAGACLINSILGSDCHVGEKARLRDVITEDEVFIGAAVRADVAWIGRRAKVLQGVHLEPATCIGPSFDPVPVTLGPGRIALTKKAVIVAPSESDVVLHSELGGELVWAAMYAPQRRSGRTASDRKLSGSQSTENDTDGSDDDIEGDSLSAGLSDDRDSTTPTSLWDTAEDRLRSYAKRQRQAITKARASDMRRSSQRDRASTSITHKQHQTSRTNTTGLTESDAGSSGPDDEGEQSEAFLIGELRHTLEHGDTENSESGAANVILELNSLKHAYNIPIEDLHFLLIKALLDLTVSRLPASKDAKADQVRCLVAEFHRQMARLDPVFQSYQSALEDGRVCMQALEDTACYQALVLEASPFIAHALYDRELVTEPAIWWWFENSPLLADEELAERTGAVREKLKPFLKWLKEAEEDEEEEEEEEDESD